MRTKIIITAASSLGLGALWGWAITGDRAANQAALERQAFRAVINDQARHINLLMGIASKQNDVIGEQRNALGLPDIEEPVEGEIDDALKHLLDDREALAGTPLPIEDEVTVTIAEVSEENDSVADVSTETNSEISAEGTPEETVQNESDIPEYELPVGETEEETRDKLKAIISPYMGGVDDEQADAFVEQLAIDFDQTPPFVISQGKYASDPDEGDGYEKITLTWYPTERVLLDDSEEPIDVQEYIGRKSLGSFGFESGDPDTMFVRNRRLSTDFEVVREMEEDLPMHVQMGLRKEEYNTLVGSGMLQPPTRRTGD